MTVRFHVDKQLVFPFVAPVMVQLGGKSELEHKVPENLLSSCLGCFGSAGVSSSKVSVVVHDHQDVLVSSFAFLQVTIVNRHQHKRIRCHYALERCSGWSIRLLALQTAAYLGDVMLDVPLHVQPVEPIAIQVQGTLNTEMSHLLMQLPVDQFVSLWLH